jgi:hypothetical protein
MDSSWQSVIDAATMNLAASPERTKLRRRRESFEDASLLHQEAADRHGISSVDLQ